MPLVKLEGVDEIKDSSINNFKVEDAADVLKNVSTAVNGDTFFFYNGEWTVTDASVLGGSSTGGMALSNVGIDVSEVTVNSVTDYIYEFGGLPSNALQVVNPTDGQALTYDASTSSWSNSGIALKITVNSDNSIDFELPPNPN